MIAVLGCLGANPLSRIGNSRFRTLDGLRETVFRSLMSESYVTIIAMFLWGYAYIIADVICKSRKCVESRSVILPTSQFTGH